VKCLQLHADPFCCNFDVGPFTRRAVGRARPLLYCPLSSRQSLPKLIGAIFLPHALLRYSYRRADTGVMIQGSPQAVYMYERYRRSCCPGMNVDFSTMATSVRKSILVS
jgi:hypothetical protein